MNALLPARSENARLLVLAIVTATMLFLYGRIDYANDTFREWDSLIYLKMAAASPALSPEAPRPFAFRLLGPYLAGLLPGPVERSFFAANIALSFLLVFMMYRFFRSFDLRPAFACAATILYIFNKHFFGFSSWNYFHVNDVITNILLIVMLSSMTRLRWLRFSAAMCLGAATRETAMIMIPVGFVYLAERRLLAREGWKFAASIVPGAAVFAAIRILIDPAEGPTLLQAVSTHWTKIMSLERMYHILVNPFVPLALVPIVFFGRSIAFFRSRPSALAFAAIVAAAPLFGHNNERLLNPAALVFYPLIGIILQDCVWPNKGAIALVLAGGFLSSLHWLIGRYPLPSRGATAALSGGSLLAVTAALVLLRIARMRKGAPPRTGGPGAREGSAPTPCSRRESS